MAITVRELVANLTVNDNATEKLGKIGLAIDGVTNIANVLVGTFNVLKTVAFDFVDDFSKGQKQFAATARSIGETNETLSKLAFAAERSSLEFDDLVDGAKEVTKRLVEAKQAGGKGAFADTLRLIGVRMDELVGIPLDQQLGILSDGLLTVEDAAQRSAHAQAIFGEEAGVRFATLISKGSAGIAELTAQAEEFGLVITDESVAASENFQKSIGDLRASAKGLKNTIGKELIPIIQPWVDRTNEAVKANRELIKLNIQKALGLVNKALEAVASRSDQFQDSFDRLVSEGIIVLDFIENVTEKYNEWEQAISDVLGPLDQLPSTLDLLQSPLSTINDLVTDLTKSFFGLADAAETAGDVTTSAFSTGKGLNVQEARVLNKELLEIAKGERSALSEGLAKLASKTTSSQLAQLRADAIGELVGTGASAEVADQAVARINRALNPISAAIANRSRKEAADRKKARDERKKQGTRSFSRVKASGGKDKKRKGLTESELAKLIDISRDTGQSLTGLIGTRKIEAGATPPVVQVRVFRTEVNQDITAPITVNGASSETAEQFAEIAEETAKDVLGSAVKEALDAVQTQVAR